jgi:hypothetical protein
MYTYIIRDTPIRIYTYNIITITQIEKKDGDPLVPLILPSETKGVDAGAGVLPPHSPGW